MNMDEMSVPFYAGGLKFECTQCSDCCRHEPGYVFLSETDVVRIQSVLGLSRRKLLDRYCVGVSIAGIERLSLKEKSNYDCIFWDDGCTIYAGRPMQCRSYPFWPSALASRDTWRTTARSCPGIGRGRVHTRDEIDTWLRLRETEPLIGDGSW